MGGIKAELVTRKARNSGKEFSAIELTFSNGYKKLVFLESAELYMLQSINNR